MIVLKKKKKIINTECSRTVSLFHNLLSKELLRTVVAPLSYLTIRQLGYRSASYKQRFIRFNFTRDQNNLL